MRALVHVQLTDLLDGDLRRLIELGLPGTLRVEATLFRRRRLWFDERRAADAWEYVLGWSREARTVTLDATPAPDPHKLGLPLLSLRPPVGAADRDHYVEVTAHLEVVTQSSLAQVARWLGQTQPGPADAGPPAPGSRLGRLLRAYVAADLARTVAARCPVR